MTDILKRPMADVVSTVSAAASIARVAPKLARYAQHQAEMCVELMRLSGATREEIQRHVSHSVYSLSDLLNHYKTLGRWACCREGQGEGDA